MVFVLVVGDSHTVNWGTQFFYKKLGSGTSTQFLMKMAFFEYSVSSRFLIQARFASFLYGNVNLLRKIDRQFLMHLEHEYS